MRDLQFPRIDKIQRFYDRLFSLDEIRSSQRLQWIHFALIAGFVMTFADFRRDPIGTISSIQTSHYTCPEYFRSCGNFFFLDSVPASYSYDFYLAGIFGLLMGSVFAAVNKRWSLAHILLLPVFLSEIVFALLLTGAPSFPLIAFSTFPSFFYLFSSRKLSHLKVLFVLMYAMAGVVKFHEGWIAGTYFTSMKDGLPLVPREAIPLATNFVILMETVAVWFLLFERSRLRHFVLAFFIFFHIYSFIFVGFRYPILCLPMLTILFAGGYAYKRGLTPLATVFFTIMVALNLRHFVIAGDSKWTFEGVSFAFTMIDANRQVQAVERDYYKDGHVQVHATSSENGYQRIRPFTHWFRIQKRCQEKPIERVEWIMAVSVDGSPYREMINVPNACALEYSSWRHNEWMHLDGKIVGYPGPNYYAGGDRVSRETPQVFSEPQIVLTPLQAGLRDNVGLISWLYGLLALLTPLATLWNRRRGPPPTSENRAVDSSETQDHAA